MSEIEVELAALDDLTARLRAVATHDLPPIHRSTTGHPELDAAIDDLRSAIDTLSADTGHAVETHALGVDRSARRYLETDTALGRSGGTQ